MEAPASTTRKEAMVTGGRYRRPTFAAMKFTAHTTTTSPIEPAITHRPGARPAAFSTYTESGQPFFANREFLDGVQPRRESDSRARGHANGALRRDGYFRLDDVLVPVAPARGHVARQRKIRQRRKRDIVRPPNPGLQHPAAPHRHMLRLADVVDLLRYRVPAHASHLDVDDLARSQRDGGLCLLQRVNAFIQANRRLQFFLQRHVTVQIVPAQRLLDHHQMERIELL